MSPYVLALLKSWQRNGRPWRCECGDLNQPWEWCCYRCGACDPRDA